LVGYLVEDDPELSRDGETWVAAVVADNPYRDR